MEETIRWGIIGCGNVTEVKSGPAFQKAVQMRIDSTESSFSPSQGRGGQAQTEQGPLVSQQPEHQRTDRDATGAVVRGRRRK